MNISELKQILLRNRRLLLVVAGAAVLLIVGALIDLPGRLRLVLNWVDGLGPVGPAAYVLLYVAVTILLIPGSILTLGAGAVFGVVWGTIYTSIGSTLGATAAFLLGRYLLRDWVAGKAAEYPRFRAIDDAIGRKGAKIIFLLRLSPLVPFNLSNYLYALSKVPVRSYMLASWAGMLPGTLLYVYIGSLIESIAVLGTAERARTAGEWILYAVGLCATVGVTVYVTRLANRAIRESVVSED